MAQVIVAQNGPLSIVELDSGGQAKVLLGENTAEAKANALVASTAATLAGHYANDALDIDVPGGAAGERGAKYWANLALARATAALVAVGIGIKAGSARFTLYFSGDKSIWFDLTPTAIKHVVIDGILAAVASLQALFATISAPAQRLASKPGPDGLYLYGADGKTFASITRNAFNHPDYASTKAQISSLVANGVSSSYLVRDSKWDSIQAIGEIIHFEGVGQSRAQGYPGTLYSTGAANFAKMFVGGVRPDDLSVDPAVIYASLADLQERYVTSMADSTANSSGSVGETPMFGAMQMIAQLLRDNDGIDPSTSGQKFLASVSARGGATAALLTKANGTRYPRTLLNMQKGPVAARAAGWSYATGGAFYTQGEGDCAAVTDPSTWKTTVRGIRSSMEADWQAATGTARPLPMFLDQTPSSANYYAGAQPDIAIAQLQLALEDDYMCHVVAPFFMAFRNNDIHMVPQGYKHLGAYYGWAAYQWLFKGYKPQPLRPVIRAEGNKIIARYPVLAGRRLVIDKATIEEMPNWGMRAFNAAGVEKALSNPKQVGLDCVVWDAAETPADQWYFGYGWSKQTAANRTVLNGGNIRDDNPLIFDPTDLNKPMYRWAPIDKITLTA
ncbi:UNVERIFIED_ORG: hypothetical protein M2348_001336 [Sphingomonas sp. R1F5B]